MLEWIKNLFKKPISTPTIVEHRGIKGYFSSEMVEEFDNAGIDYAKEFREAVDEFLDEIDEDDQDNPYR